MQQPVAVGPLAPGDEGRVVAINDKQDENVQVAAPDGKKFWYEAAALEKKGNQGFVRGDPRKMTMFANLQAELNLVHALPTFCPLVLCRASWT